MKTNHETPAPNNATDDAGLTGIAAEIVDVIGPDMAACLLHLRGGTKITVPKKAEGSWLAGVIGLENTQLMIWAFGPGDLRLPTGNRRGVAGRREAAKRMLAEGASTLEVALALDLHTRTVENYRAAMKRDPQSTP